MTTQLDDFLAARSSLTKKQIDRLTLQISLQRGGNEDEKGESRSTISGVSQGSYYRVLEPGPLEHRPGPLHGAPVLENRSYPDGGPAAAARPDG